MPIFSSPLYVNIYPTEKTITGSKIDSNNIILFRLDKVYMLLFLMHFNTDDNSAMT